MSKIKVNELEAKNENTNVKLTPVGSGGITIKGAGGNDGTLQLKTLQGTNGVKLKSPPHSAGQSYTLTLPDNNVEADKFLRVKSKTGSGNTATGQLECATLENADLTQLNASNLTSGTLATSVLPTALPATSGAGLILENHTVITNNTNTNIVYLDFTNLLDNTEYKLIIKKLRFAAHSSELRFRILGAAGGSESIARIYTYHYAVVKREDSGSLWDLKTGLAGVNQKNVAAVFDFSTKANYNWGSFMAIHCGAEENGCYGYFSTENQYGQVNSPRVGGIRLYDSYSYHITDADVLLYRFAES